MKRGKKYIEAAKAIDRTVQYDTAEAISLVKKAAVAKFDGTSRRTADPWRSSITARNR